MMMDKALLSILSIHIKAHSDECFGRRIACKEGKSVSRGNPYSNKNKALPFHDVSALMQSACHQVVGSPTQVIVSYCELSVGLYRHISPYE